MVIRRDLLRSGIAAGAAGLGLTSANTVSAAPAGDFVRADGTQLTVDGEPFYFNGTNNYRLTDPYTDRADVDRDLELYAQHEINAVRTWAFCSGDGGHCFQPEPGVYTQTGLQHLDYVVAKARQHGIRLVLPFTNYWTQYGGMQQYVDWVSSADHLGDFYTNSECRQLYKDWIDTLLTRENTFTGVEYRNDPTIMMWELANEPRLKTEDTNGEMTTDEIQQTMHNWIDDMSSYVKSIAPNQLVSTGMEGFYDKDRNSDNWRVNGSHGTAFLDNHTIDTVDVASIHLYPHHWPGMSIDEAVDWIKQHAMEANDTLNMPFYCGEFNVHDNNESLRPEYLDDWYTAMDNYDVDGALIWQFLSDDTQSSDGFSVRPGDPAVSEIDQFGEIQRSKSGPGGGTGSPHAELTVEDPILAGEKARFHAPYSFDPDGSISSYDWDFGDGVSASGADLFHSYDSAGDFNVDLDVTDDSGNTTTDTETVTVENLPDGSFVVQGSGEGLNKNSKEYHYAYQQVSGDQTVVAKVASLDGTTKGAQAGILAKDGLTTSDAGGAISMTTLDGLEFLHSWDGGTMNRMRRTWDSADANTAPFWIKLERSGDTLDGYYSADGSSWSQLASKSVDFTGDDFYIGLFVSSSNAGELATARFDSVSWLSSWSSVDVGAVDIPGNTAAGSETSSGNTAPTASISASDTSVLVGDTVSFDGSGSSDSDGSITSYEWAFGDGTTATGATVSHSYSSADSYTVSLTVTDDDGATGGDTVSVTVNEDTPPSAPTNLTVDATTTTSADLSWDASSDTETSVDYYNVYVDGVLDQQTSSTNATVSGLSENTSYQFGVSAVDTEGNESTTTTTSATTDGGNSAPTASISASDTSVLVGDTVSFDGSGSSDSDGSIASYEWTFGDGTTATGATVSHSYGSADTYTVSLTVTDDDGATGSDSVSVTVNEDSPPTQPSNLTADATTSTSVDLSWDASSDTETSVDYYNVYVDGSFDHQTSSTSAAVSGLSSDTSYQFGVSAVDTEGNESTQATTSATTDSGNSAPTASISASDTSVLVGESVSFDGSGSSDSDGSVASYEWAFGDGTTATGATVSHSYSSADSYTISLTVTDDDGATGSDSISVTVNEDTPPSAPTNLTVDATTTTSADLSWDASSDTETSVDYYNVYVDGSFDHQISSTSATVSGLSSDTSYQFGVSAVDTEGNESTQATTSATTDSGTSSSDTFTDPCDDLTKLGSGSDTTSLTTDSSNKSYFERPDGSTDGSRIHRTGTTADRALVYGPGGELTDGIVEFHWHETEGGDIRVEESTDGGSTWSTASTTRSDYGGVDGYWYHTEVSISFSSGVDRARLVLTAGSVDWAGQIGNVELNYTTDGDTSDTTAPSAPSNLSVTGTSTSTVDVSWDTVSDSGSGLDHYDVYVDGSFDQQVAAGTTSATVSGLSSDTSYTIGVSATDGAGNESNTSTVSATTGASDAFTDPCDNLTKLGSGSDTTSLTTDSSNETYFERPDGSTDGSRIHRTGTTADRALVYGPGSELTDGVVEFHWHKYEGGDIRVEESTDGGSTWSTASTTRSDYGGEDGYWYHREVSISFSSGADRVRLVLTGASVDWAGQIGNVELNYTTE